MVFCTGKPFHATKVLVTCGHGQALVTWQSSYFGYRRQYSLVQYSTDNVKFINGSEITTEYTKEEILQTSVHNLQDSTHYFFRVFTMNTHGFSTSIPINCSTAATQGFHFEINFLLFRVILYVFSVLVLLVYFIF